MKLKTTLTVISSGLLLASFAWGAEANFSGIIKDRRNADRESTDAIAVKKGESFPWFAVRGTSENEMNRIQAPSRMAEENEVIYKWDFNGFSAGTPDAPDSEEVGKVDMTIFDEGPIDSEYTGEEGWTGMGIFQAGGSVLIDPSKTGIGIASISTPELEPGEVFTVEVKAKTVDGSESTLYAASSYYKDGAMYPETQSDHAAVTGEWTTMRFVFRYSETHDNIRLQLMSMSKGILVDEMTVYSGEKKSESDFTPDDDITHPSDAEVIIDEDFSLFTEGSLENPTTETLTDNFIIDSKYTHTPGWSGYRVRQAGGAAALNDDYDSCINTSPADFSGHVTMTFRVYGLTKRTSIYCTLAKDPYESSSTMIEFQFKQIRGEGKWTWVRFEFDNRVGSDACYFQIHPFSPCIIDDVKISSQNSLIAEPTLLPASDFTQDGFTANWDKVVKATDYLLSAYREVPVDPGSTLEEEESFESIAQTGALPEGWFVSVAEGSGWTDDEALAYDGRFAIELSNEGDYLELPSNGGTLLQLMPLARAVGNRNDQGIYDAQVHVSVFDGYKWKDISTYWIFTNDSWGTLDMSYETAGFYKVRISASGVGGESKIYIDDVFRQTTSPTERDYVFEDVSTTATSYRIDNLDPMSDYFYTVKARNESLGLVSEVTGAMEAFGIATPVATEATEISARGAFTANWEDVQKATGYGINTYKIYTAKEDGEIHEVLNEDFSGVAVGATPGAPLFLDNYTLSSLGGFTKDYGWYGFLTLLCDGAVGSMSIPDYGLYGQIQTPELSLSNNGGKCHVEIEAYGVDGDDIILQNKSGKGLAMTGNGKFMEYSGDLTGCTENDVLVFYSSNNQNFFISSLKITQTLDAGDKVAKMIRFDDSMDESFRVTGLDTANDEYAYDVYSIYHKYTKTCYSEYSNRVYANLSSSVENVMDEDCISIALEGDILKVNTTSETGLRVCDLAGMQVVSAVCTVGTNEIKLPSKGLYVVMVSDKVVKILVK